MIRLNIKLGEPLWSLTLSDGLRSQAAVFGCSANILQFVMCVFYCFWARENKRSICLLRYRLKHLVNFLCLDKFVFDQKTSLRARLGDDQKGSVKQTNTHTNKYWDTKHGNDRTGLGCNVCFYWNILQIKTINNVIFIECSNRRPPLN